MAASTGGYNPLGYHTGSVWSHDTMIAARGLAAEGFRAEAIELAKGVLDASVEFAGRLPELYGGYPASDGPPTAYAASCRPQAWAAAATIEALRIFVGLKPDVPHQLIAIAETAPDVALGLHLNGLRMGHKPVSLRVTDTKRIELEVDGLRITQAKVVGAANPASYLSGG
jgi:glycogen debranching enzyme